MMTITKITDIDDKKYIAFLDTSSISFMQGLHESNKEAGIKRYDVGVDANGYMPVSIRQIESFLKLQE